MKPKTKKELRQVAPVIGGLILVFLYDIAVNLDDACQVGAAKPWICGPWAKMPFSSADVRNVISGLMGSMLLAGALLVLASVIWVLIEGSNRDQ